MKGYNDMPEYNKKVYDHAFDVTKKIEAAACYLLGDIGYWGGDGKTDEDTLEMAERHLARLCDYSKEMALALADMRRVIEEAAKEEPHVD